FSGDMAVQGFKILAKTGDGLESPFNGMATSQERLRARAERVRKSLKALLASFRRIKQDRAGSIEYIRQSFKVGERIAENSNYSSREVKLKDITMPDSAYKTSTDWAYSRGEPE